MKKNVFFFGKKVTKLANNRRSQRKWFSLSICSHSIKWYSASVPRHPPLQTSNTRIYTYIDSRACTYSLWCAVSLWHQQRSHLLCAAPSAIEPALSLLHVYFKGVEPFADSQCRDTGLPISSPPSTQHLGTDGFAEIIQQMDNFPLPFPF